MCVNKILTKLHMDAFRLRYGGMHVTRNGTAVLVEGTKVGDLRDCHSIECDSGNVVVLCGQAIIATLYRPKLAAAIKKAATID